MLGSSVGVKPLPMLAARTEISLLNVYWKYGE